MKELKILIKKAVEANREARKWRAFKYLHQYYKGQVAAYMDAAWSVRRGIK